MNVVRNIIGSNIFVVVVIPLVIIVGVLYICKVYKFSLIPKSLKRKKKSKFKMPTISRKEINKSLGYAGKYKWAVDEDDNNMGNNIESSGEKDYVPNYSSARVVPAVSHLHSRKNMYG